MQGNRQGKKTEWQLDRQTYFPWQRWEVSSGLTTVPTQDVEVWSLRSKKAVDISDIFANLGKWDDFCKFVVEANPLFPQNLFVWPQPMEWKSDEISTTRWPPTRSPVGLFHSTYTGEKNTVTHVFLVIYRGPANPFITSRGAHLVPTFHNKPPAQLRFLRSRKVSQVYGLYTFQRKHTIQLTQRDYIRFTPNFGVYQSDKALHPSNLPVH